MDKKIKLTLDEQIDRARAGRTQTYIVRQLNEMGIPMNDVQFSRKKLRSDSFTDKELSALQEILGVELVVD